MNFSLKFDAFALSAIQKLDQTLFESITYDLDSQQIADFQLKPWADRYMVVRANLYDSIEAEKAEYPPFQEVGTNMPPRGSSSYPRYYEIRFLVAPVPRASRESTTTLAQLARNDTIRGLRAEGFSYPEIAKALGIAVGTAWNATHDERR